ncbi:unnamed protein product, partial [Iphiclides podalirius]
MAKIPKNPRSNCYFGCGEGDSDMERFDVWKGVLDNDTIEKGNVYIYNQLRLCNKHFENFYKSPSNRLTRNAVPTLSIKVGTTTCTILEPSLEEFDDQSSTSNQPITATIPCDDTTSPEVIMDDCYTIDSRPSRKPLRNCKWKSALTYNYVQMNTLSARIKKLRSELRLLQKKRLHFKMRLTRATKVSEDSPFRQVTKNFEKPAQILFNLQSSQTSKDKYSVAYVTVPTTDLGKTMGHGLVKNKLAACVNVIPEVTSIYNNAGETYEDNETLLMIKTRTSQVDRLTEYVRSNHPYDVCEVISLPINNGNPPYLKWIGDSVPES